ncbi:hypothetical protein ACWEV4_02565 [Streptomyces sp. NPDC003860]
MINYMPMVPAAIGLATGFIGLATDTSGLAYLGVLSVLSAVPPLIISATRNATRVRDYQLAEADRAGYARALDHVARGLLTPPTAPPSGGQSEESILQQVAGVVIPLRRTDIEERKAQ